MIVTKQVLKRPNRMPCLGDLRARAILHVRSMRVPDFESVDFDEDFAGIEVWASIKSTVGKVQFTDVGIDTAITHKFVIRYRDDVSAETYVEFERRRFNVVSVEDLEERHEFLSLNCREHGSKDLESTKS